MTVSRFFSIFSALVFSILFSACGGGEPRVPFTTAVEVKTAFDNAPNMLSDYFGSEGLNPDTKVLKSQIAPAYPIFGSVWYKGKEIYNGKTGGGYYTSWGVSHGFAIDGAYVIVVRKDSSTFIFVDGKPLPLERKSLDFSLRDGGRNWWLITFFDGGLRDPFPATKNMAILNKKTGELIEFGVSPL